MSITLSDSAAARVSSFLANRGKGFGLRLGVRTSGCSGMAGCRRNFGAYITAARIIRDTGITARY